MNDLVEKIAFRIEQMRPAMLANPIGRSTPEWWGKTNDAMPPRSVQLRVLARQGGLCALTGLPIRDGDLTTPDHIRELILGGENREANIQIVLRWAHTGKTSAAMAVKAKADAAKSKGLGMKPAGVNKIKSAGFRKFEKPSKIGKCRIDKSKLPY